MLYSPGFTIDLVNSPNGPIVFYSECAAVFAVIILYYVSKGWIDAYSIKKYFKTLLCGKNRSKQFLLEEDFRNERAAKTTSTPIKTATPKASKRSSFATSAAAARADKINEAVEEEVRRAREAQRKRAMAQEITKSTSRSSTIRFSVINGNGNGAQGAGDRTVS